MNVIQNQTFSILFWANKNRANRHNELPIYARITIDGKRTEISLQRSAPEALWDQHAQQLKGKGEIQMNINTFLDLTKANIQKVYNQLLAEDKFITANLIKQKLLGKGDPMRKTICDASLADLGCSLLWKMFRNGMIQNRGLFLNLNISKSTPVPVG